MIKNQILKKKNESGILETIYPVSHQSLIYNDEGKSTKDCFDEIDETLSTKASIAYVDSKFEGVLKYKGAVSDPSYLPEENNNTGDVYNDNSTGANYVWSGLEWDKLSEDANSNQHTTLAGYGITDAYNKTEINRLLNQLTFLKIEAVTALPTGDNIKSNVIYLLPLDADDPITNDTYEEYVYINGNWEKLGTTTVELSGYMKTPWSGTLAQYDALGTYDSNQLYFITE